MCRHSYVIDIRVILPQMEDATFETFHITMPVSVNDQRQIWLRKNAPRPQSLQSVKIDNKLRVVMDTGSVRFGQFYKINAMVSYLHGNITTFMYWLRM